MIGSLFDWSENLCLHITAIFFFFCLRHLSQPALSVALRGDCHTQAAVVWHNCANSLGDVLMHTPVSSLFHIQDVLLHPCECGR